MATAQLGRRVVSSGQRGEEDGRLDVRLSEASLIGGKRVGGGFLPLHHRTKAIVSDARNI